MVDKKVLLAYGLANKDLNILKTFNKEYIIVKDNMTGTKIEDLINGVEILPSEKSIPKEKIILINGYSNKEVDVLIKIIRGAMGKRVIIAVITENSNSWTFDYLATEHLIKERDWYKKNNK